MINPRALHVRLIAWHVGLLSVLVLIFGSCTYFGMRHYLVFNMQTTLARRAVQIADYVTERLPNMGNASFINEIKTLYAPEVNDRFIRITRSNGSVLYASGMPKDLSFDPAGIAGVLSRTVQSQRSEPTINENRLYIATVVTATNGNNHQRYIVEVGTSDVPLQNALHGLFTILIVGFFPLLALCAGGAYLLIERSLAPVTTIMNAAENISLHNLNNRLPIAMTGDKLEHLSRALNRMITRLDAAYQQASRFTADASHELRTPLTVIRGELESILRQTHLRADMREQIASVLEETERLGRITEGLLAIARLESGEAKAEHAIVDLAELVRSTLEQMQLLAEENRLSIAIDAPQPVFVRGDAARLKQVIINLLDNAIKYTLPQGAIVFSVKTIPPMALLSVEDNGIGISSDALPHVFERFYRADKIRSSSSRGTGLGLSIVRIVCQAHGGTVRLHSEQGRGTTVTIELPIADSDYSQATPPLRELT